MDITKRKLINAKKNIEIAIVRLEQLYPTEYDIIDKLKENRIQIGWVIREVDVYSKIEEKAN